MSETVHHVEPLGEALHFLRMNGAFYCRCELSAPWAIDLPAMPDSWLFHVVTSGECWMEGDGIEPLLLRQGDLALVPHGEGHRLASEAGRPGVGLFDIPRDYLGDRFEVISLNGGGESARVICGAVRFDHPAARQLAASLPRTIYVDGSQSDNAEWTRTTVELIASEAKELKPGGETIITRLADVLVIQALRSWIERDPAALTGWLGALRDPQIGRAISLIHNQPSRSWTVESLADEVAMSRSAFAARFTALAGVTPMHYLTHWRMQVALDELKQGRDSVAEIAFRLGYRSEAAFSRAFKRVTGVSPGSIRRTAPRQLRAAAS